MSETSSTKVPDAMADTFCGLNISTAIPSPAPPAPTTKPRPTLAGIPSELRSHVFYYCYTTRVKKSDPDLTFGAQAGKAFHGFDSNIPLVCKAFVEEARAAVKQAVAIVPMHCKGPTSPTRSQNQPTTDQERASLEGKELNDTQYLCFLSTYRKHITEIIWAPDFDPETMTARTQLLDFDIEGSPNIKSFALTGCEGFGSAVAGQPDEIQARWRGLPLTEDEFFGWWDTKLPRDPPGLFVEGHVLEWILDFNRRGLALNSSFNMKIWVNFVVFEAGTWHLHLDLGRRTFKCGATGPGP